MVKAKWPVSQRDRGETRWVKRDSPAMPETRANGSPDGEVSRLRDFPKGNIDERAPSLPLVFKDFCPPALRPASSLISPAPSCGPPSHVPVATGSFGGSPLPFREDPKFLSAAFNTFRDLPPRHSFPLAPGTHPELQVPQAPDSFTNSPPASGFHTSARVPSATGTFYPPGRTDSLLLSRQNPVRLSPPLAGSHPSKEYESLLPLGSLPPPGHPARGAFTDVRSNRQARTVCLLATAEPRRG